VRAVSPILLFLSVLLCSACWRSHSIGEPEAAGTGGVEAGAGGTGGQAGRAGQAASGAGGFGGYAGVDREPSATCGDGVVNGAEECDGLDLGGESCASLGWSSGTLFCHASTCSFDLSMCASDPGQVGPSVYPDGRVYPIPETFEECMELTAFLGRTYFERTIPFAAQQCSCARCLDTVGPCLVDYDCLNVVGCCTDAGYYDISCGTGTSVCADAISPMMSNSYSSGLTMGLADCFQAECRDTVPAP